MTVLGPIDQNELGFTSMHEHILLNGGFLREETRKLISSPDKSWFPSSLDDPVKMENLFYLNRGYHSQSYDNCILDEELMIKEVQDYKIAGGSAILELSIPGIRGDVLGLKRISEKTGVHIIASTGLYAEESWPERFHDMSVKELVSYMIKEVEEGIQDTDIKAGHLKFGPNSMSSKEKKMVSAIAIASRETGLSATLHHGLRMTKDQGREMVKILKSENVNPERIILAHADKLTFNYPESYMIKNYVIDPDFRKLDLDYVKELLDYGFNLSFDTFGHNWHHEATGLMNQTDYERLAGLVALINEGYSEQLVIGCDVYTKTCTRRYGGSGYSRLLNFVVPTLREIGISEEDVKNIIINNPARLLSSM